MKSWAQTYLAGSLLGTALIVAALVAFVALVSLSAPDEWPTPGLGLGGGGDAGVSGAVAVERPRPATGGLDSNPSVGQSVAASTAVGVARAQGPGSDGGNGASGRAETGTPPQTVAVAPASAEVVARDPGPRAPEGIGVAPSPPANPTETGSAPASATTGAEVGSPGETSPAGPIAAGVGGEEPEAPSEEPEAPPEEAEAQPPEGGGPAPPPSGGSVEEGGVPGLPDQGGEGEDTQPGSGDLPPGSALQLEPGALGPEVADRRVADLALAAPRLVDVTPDR